MAHFAKVDENGLVLAVHVVDNEVIMVDGVESEQAGIDFLSSLHGHSLWVQTSYNRTFRKNYAFTGCTYDSTRDVFIPPKTHPSWVLNDEFCAWEPPIPMPETEGRYKWSEEDLNWIEQVQL